MGKGDRKAKAEGGGDVRMEWQRPPETDECWNYCDGYRYVIYRPRDGAVRNHVCACDGDHEHQYLLARREGEHVWKEVRNGANMPGVTEACARLRRERCEVLEICDSREVRRAMPKYDDGPRKDLAGVTPPPQAPQPPREPARGEVEPTEEIPF